MPVERHEVRAGDPIERQQPGQPLLGPGTGERRRLCQLAAAHLRTVLLVPVDRARMERLDHIRAVIRLQQLVALLHQLVRPLAPRGVVGELVLHDHRYTSRDHAQHVDEQRHVLVVALRSELCGGHRVGDGRRLGIPRLRGRGEQRDARQLLIRQVGDLARISGHAQQVIVMHDHHAAVLGELHVQFDAESGLTGGGERSQRILRGDRAAEVSGPVSRAQCAATRQRHILAAVRRILRRQSRSRVMQATMRIPYVRNRRHEMTLLVAERTRLDGPDRGARGYGSGKHQLAANMFSHSVSPNRAVGF